MKVYTAVAVGMPTTISTSKVRENAVKNATRKARKAFRSMKISGAVPDIAVKEHLWSRFWNRA